MSFIGHHNHVATVSEHFCSLEFVDEGKDVALVATQELA